jgi:hypothetical protein
MTNVNKERDRVSFRLRNVDDDLREATKGLADDRLSDLARDGLRLILGIKTTKRVEVAERPIITRELPQQTPQTQPQQAQTIRGNSAAWRPESKGGRRA